MPAEKFAGVTSPQLEELERLARGAQPTYGYARARVQNNLYYGRHYVRFLDDDGQEVEPHRWGISNPAASQCAITAEGRAALERARAAKTAARAAERRRVRT